MATPSKLDIIRAAGKVQREIAAEIHQDGAAVPPPDTSNVTTRRHKDPVDQITAAQDELGEVQADLQHDQVLLRRLRGTGGVDFSTGNSCLLYTSPSPRDS